MAKPEHEDLTLPKGKKRKHDATGDDEVPNKSIIIESEEKSGESSQDNQKNKKSGVKRKSDDKCSIKEKRNKLSATYEDISDAEDNPANNESTTGTVDDDLHEPTMEELRESEKPENTNAVVTVRQKKKLKHQQRLSEQKEQSGDKETKRNKEYLQKWKHARAQWKFEKLRQISIQQTIFDEHKIDTDIWPIALEYLSGTQGAAKKKLCKLAEGVIDELDKECEAQQDDCERQVIVDSVKYQRARDLLQCFE